MAYAEVEDYLFMYDTDMDEERIGAYLERASRKIDATLAANGASVPAIRTEALSQALSDTCIDMAHRVIGDSCGASEIGLPDGITSYSQTQGGFTESFSWAQPFTDMKMRDDELELILSLLGRDVSGFGMARMGGDWA